MRLLGKDLTVASIFALRERAMADDKVAFVRRWMDAVGKDVLLEVSDMLQ